MATVQISGLTPAVDNDISLAGTKVLVEDDNGDTVYATPQQLHDADADPVKDSYNLNGVQGAASGGTSFVKRVSSIPNNSATTALTITIPNAAHSGAFLVTVLAWLGAGGAVGAHEAVATAVYLLRFARTAGVNAVAGFTTVAAAANSSVAGATSLTLSGAVSSVSGAVGASNSFNFTVTVARGSGSSANHEVLLKVETLNAEASGITVA